MMKGKIYIEHNHFHKAGTFEGYDVFIRISTQNFIEVQGETKTQIKQRQKDA